MPIACIVEGHGEVKALPILLDRMNAWLSPDDYRTLSRPPVRVKRDRFLNRPEEFERFMRLAAAKAGAAGSILVLLDADDDCPARLGPALAARARVVVPDLPISIVLANREFEAWFLAAAPSLDGIEGFDAGRWSGADPDAPRNAKGRIDDCLNGNYREVRDQAGLTARFDLVEARSRSRSFRKLCKEWPLLRS